MEQDFFSQFPWPNAAYDIPYVDKPKEKRHISRLSLGFLILLLLPTVLLNGAAIISILLGKIFPVMDNWLSSLTWTNFINYLILYAIALPLFYLVVKALPTETPTQNHLRFSQGLLYFVLAMGLMVIGSVIGNVVMAIPEAIFQKENPLGTFTGEVPLWFSALLMGVVAPFGEELIFRKLMIDRLHRYGTVTACVVSAAFFGFFHQNLYQFFYAFLVGLLLGYLYQRTGKYLYCAFLHMAINLAGGVLPTVLQALLNMPADAPADWMPETFVQMQSMLALFVLSALQYACAIACVVLFILFWKKWIILRRGTCQLQKQDWAGVVLGNTGMVLVLCATVILFFLSIIG